MPATGLEIKTPPTPDPNAVPPTNVSGDANKVVVDPNKAAGEAKADEKKILGKFDTQADLEKAYVELEKKQGGKAEEKKVEATTPEQAREAVQKAGLDMAALSKEYTDNQGKLTDETYKALEAKGISRETVNTFIDGQKAIGTQMRTEFEQIAGDANNLKALYDWAGSNMSADEVKTYNSLVESGNLAGAKLALEGMVSRYNEAMGSDPNLVGGEAAPSRSGAQPFASNDELVRAMADPRYQTDPAYRAKIEARLAGTEMNVRSY